MMKPSYRATVDMLAKAVEETVMVEEKMTD